MKHEAPQRSHDRAIDRAATLLLKARSVVVLTGAGVSAESGIPTFRDAQAGLWAKYDPMTLASTRGFTADPGLVWRWYMSRFADAGSVAPNPGHHALASLERWVTERRDEAIPEQAPTDPGPFPSTTISTRAPRGPGDPGDRLPQVRGATGPVDRRPESRGGASPSDMDRDGQVRPSPEGATRGRGSLPQAPESVCRSVARGSATSPSFSLFTQNIDDLHEKAGSVEVHHLHGSIHRYRCNDCRREHVLREDERTAPLPPSCRHCSGLVRPDVVWFGEVLPVDVLERAHVAVLDCQAVLVAGTSGVVYPAAQLPRMAKASGASVIDVNPEPTSISAIADVFLEGRSGDILPALMVRLRKRTTVR